MSVPEQIVKAMQLKGAALIFQSLHLPYLKKGIYFARVNAVAVPALVQFLSADFIINDFSLWGGALLTAGLPFALVQLFCSRIPASIYLLPRRNIQEEPQLVIYRLNMWRWRLCHYRQLVVRASDITMHRRQKFLLAAWKDKRTNTYFAVQPDLLTNTIPDLRQWISKIGATSWDTMGFWEGYKSRIALMSGFSTEEHKDVGYIGPKKSKKVLEEFSRLD